MKRMWSRVGLISLMLASLKNSNVEVKSLNVKEAQELDIEVEEAYLGGRTFTPRYTKAVASGGILFITLNGIISNKTEETISASNVRFSISNIPENVGSRIVCFSGEKVSDEVVESGTQICAASIAKGNTLNTISNSYWYKGAKNKMILNVGVSSLTAGSSEQFDSRTFIVLF